MNDMDCDNTWFYNTILIDKIAPEVWLTFWVYPAPILHNTL